MGRMSAWMYAALAASAAVAAETYYRANQDQPWGLVLWPGIVLALVVNYGIWGLTRTQSLVELAILFSLFTAGLRVAITLIRGEPISPGVWVAFGLVVLATILKSVWR